MKINPFLIFIWLIGVVFLSLIIYSLPLLILIFASSIAPCLLFRTNLWKTYMKYSAITALFIFIFNILLIRDGQTLYSFQLIRITKDAVIFSLSMVFRFLSIVSAFSLFSSLVSLHHTINILEKLRVPQKAIMSIALSLRFFPAIIEDSRGIMEALHSRGVKFKEEKFKMKIAERIPLLTSLLMVSLERSVKIAEALEIKGFPSERRVVWKGIYFTPRDKFVVALLILDMFFAIAYIPSNNIYLGITASVMPLSIFLGVRHG